MPAGDERDARVLTQALVLMARNSGVAIDEETAARLAPLLESLVRDGEALTRAAGPAVEPMAVGRWPEDDHAVD